MNIYLIYCAESTGFDAYDSIVVAAESEESALKFNPENDPILSNKYKQRDSFGVGICCVEPWSDNLGILYIGESNLQHEQIIMGSFNRA
jgi:hypothetical protein